MNNRNLTTQLVHLTYRTYGSIPANEIIRIGRLYDQAKRNIRERFRIQDRQPGAISYFDYLSALHKMEMEYYLRYDNWLDQHQDQRMGYFLEEPEAKQIIIDFWHFIAEQENLTIYVICVMSNHVHIILRANDEEADIDLLSLLTRHKKWTAREINKLVGQVGRKLWAKDVFDRDVRTGRFPSVLWYVLNNPKKAGITNDVFAFSGSWWDPRLEAEYIKPYRSLPAASASGG